MQPGEVVSIKYTGDVEGAKYAYPNFKVSRRPALPDGAEATKPDAAVEADADIPF